MTEGQKQQSCCKGDTWFPGQRETGEDKSVSVQEKDILATCQGIHTVKLQDRIYIR